MKPLYILRWTIQSTLARFGYAPLIFLALLFVCFLAQSGIASLQHERVMLNQALSSNSTVRPKGAETNSSVSDGATPAKPTQYIQSIPAADDIHLAMSRFYQAAEKQQVSLYQGQYHLLHQKYGKLTAYEIELPVKAGYPQLRRFIDQALADIPSLALESASFKRQKVDDPLLDAELKFTLYLRTE